MYLQDINIMKKKKVKNIKDDQDARSDPNIGEVGIDQQVCQHDKEEMKCKFKMSHLEGIKCLKLAILMVIIDMLR